MVQRKNKATGSASSANQPEPKNLGGVRGGEGGRDSKLSWLCLFGNRHSKLIPSKNREPVIHKEMLLHKLPFGGFIYPYLQDLFHHCTSINTHQQEKEECEER